MDSKAYEFLKNLINSMSPSGFEQEAADIWRDYTSQFADEVRRDLHGNTIAVVNKGGAPRVMLAGHIDEIGYMVKYIDDDGFIYFAPIGGVDPQIAQGQRVIIKGKKGKILGVIGKKPIHLFTPEDRNKVVKFEDMFIDIGAKSKEGAEEYVSVGDPIVNAPGFDELLGDIIVGRGFDDRVGAFVVAEALRLLSEDKPQAEVYSVATVQEEIGLRGARTSAFGIDPKIGIAVDVTFAMDTPKLKGQKELVGDIKIGGGPVIARGPNINHKLFELFVKTAEEEGIPYQIEGIPRGTGTDANVIQLTRAGVAAGLISIPNRYMHTPCEIVSKKDLENAARLIAATVRKITEDTDFTPY